MIDTLKTSELAKIIDVKFKDLGHLEQALIHRSYLNENRQTQLIPNERYEFLGDAVLELWTSQTLFHRFPEYKEGDLTNLRSLIVCTDNLALVAANFNLGNFIALSKGEETHGGRKNASILADTFEAVIGAVYLDQGWDSVAKFLDRILNPSIDEISNQNVYKDPKSLFQEIAQSQKGVTPHYITLEESGPDHYKTFKVGVFIDQEQIATGQGQSKQKAEEDAARQGFKILKNDNN